LALGDVITTRRNQRQLLTTRGESVRNRDYWTIDSIHHDGALDVTRIDGHGTVTLPADYVTEHVQLGYAATEPGNQSDTADGSASLINPATTRRGMYVAITRGRGTNQLCVVTETHDVADAVDVLEHVLVSDRVDIPATRTRHDLAAQIPHPPPLTPRHPIPDWFQDARELVYAAVQDSLEQHRADEHERGQRQRRIDQLTHQLEELEPDWEPHARAIASARSELDAARVRRRAAADEIAQSSWLTRPAARRRLADADQDVAAARSCLDQTVTAASPLAAQRTELHSKRDRLHRDARSDRTWQQSSADYLPDHETFQRHLDALDTWRKWAIGHHVEADELGAALPVLRDAHPTHSVILTDPLEQWLTQRGLTPTPPQPGPQAPEIAL
jgi:hypothetical protein